MRATVESTREGDMAGTLSPAPALVKGGARGGGGRARAARRQAGGRGRGGRAWARRARGRGGRAGARGARPAGPKAPVGRGEVSHATVAPVALSQRFSF